MNLFKLTSLAALLLAFGVAQAQETTYTFQSQTFDLVSGSYTSGQSVSGSITLTEPLAPNTTTNVNSILVGYSFSDGVVTIDDTNSETIVGIELTTDAFGGIQSYQMTFWESPLPTARGETFIGLDLFFIPGAGAPGCTESPTCGRAQLQISSGELECTTVISGECISAAQIDGDNWGRISRVAEETGFNPDFDDSIWGGGPPPQPSQPIPALGSGALVLLMLMLAGLGGIAVRLRAV